MLNVIPFFFFFISILFRVLDISVKIYEIIDNEENFVFGVPIKLMKQALNNVAFGNNVKRKIKRKIFYRKNHYIFLILSFLIMLFIGVS